MSNDRLNLSDKVDPKHGGYTAKVMKRVCDGIGCGKEIKQPSLGFGAFELVSGNQLRVFMAKPKEKGEVYAQIGDFCDDCLKAGMKEVINGI